jgi:hypothetical protein
MPTYTGTKQGAPLSPLLWNIYLDEATQTLPPNKLSQPGDNELLILFYADDIVVSGPIDKVNRALEALQKFAQDFDIIFSDPKCIQVGPGETRINNNTIPIKNVALYLGILFDEFGISDSQKGRTLARLSSSTLLADNRLDLKCLPLNKRLAIFKTFVRSKMEYGTQMAPLVNIDNQMMARIHRITVNKILKLPGNWNADLLNCLLNVSPPTQRHSILALTFHMRSNENRFLNRLILDAIEPMYNDYDVLCALTKIKEILISDFKNNDGSINIDLAIKNRGTVMKKANKLLSLDRCLRYKHVITRKEELLRQSPASIIATIGDNGLLSILDNPNGEVARLHLNKLCEELPS